MMETYLVPPGEFKVTTDASVILETYLGSCVAISLFDRYARVAGLIHIILPQGSKEKEALFPARYARTGITLLISEMLKLGASKENIVAEVAGGALIRSNKKLSVDMNIGRRNSDMAEEMLTQEGIPIVNKAIGGYRGRILRLESNSGKTDTRYMGEKVGRREPPVKPKKIEFQDLKTRIESLKPIPDKARRVISFLEFYPHGPTEMEKYVLKDQAITANVLKECNSDQYGFKHNVQSISNAANLLGTDTLKEIIFDACTYKLYEEGAGSYSTEEGDLSRHSVYCGMVAELIAREKRLENPKLFYTAGLLHDMGKLILDQYLFENFNLIMDRVNNEAKTFLEAENEILGYNHAQIGGVTAMDWGFPQALVEAISFHHMPEKAIDNSKVVSVVHIADIICSMFGAGSSASMLGDQPYQSALSTVDLRTEDVDTIIEQLPDVIKEVNIV